ncbi:hypothetical protein [Lysobacter gummosus]
MDDAGVWRAGLPSLGLWARCADRSTWHGSFRARPHSVIPANAGIQ